MTSSGLSTRARHACTAYRKQPRPCLRSCMLLERLCAHTCSSGDFLRYLVDKTVAILEKHSDPLLDVVDNCFAPQLARSELAGLGVFLPRVGLTSRPIRDQICGGTTSMAALWPGCMIYRSPRLGIPRCHAQ